MFLGGYVRWGLLGLSCLVVLSASPTVSAAPITSNLVAQQRQVKVIPQAALARLFQSKKVSPDWFTGQFINAVPLPKIQALINQLKQLGEFESVQPDGNDWIVRFSQGDVPAKISLNPEGKIAGLLFSAPTQRVASLDDAIAKFSDLPGKVSIMVREGKKVRASLNPELRLGVGSAFKLEVLAELQSQIAAKQLTWQTVVPLQAQYKSLPSGRLQTWPSGNFLTVQTLAAMMISESDNTATDHLVQRVGRENLEANSPQNVPFLMTREFFQLKSAKNQDLLKRYREGNSAERRSLLKPLADRPLPSVSEFTRKPMATDVEWFYTTAQLCDLMDRVADLPLMGINPGVAKAQDWQQIAYKGGSEVGVLNLTTRVRSRTGKCYCIAATWNADQPLDETKFASLYGGILSLLKQDT